MLLQPSLVIPVRCQAVRGHAKKQEKYEQVVAERQLADLLGQGESSEEAGDVPLQHEDGAKTA